MSGGTLHSRGGTLSSRVAPVFSHDGSVVFCATPTAVKAFAVATGKTLRVLEGSSSTTLDVVVAMWRNAGNSRQLLVVTASATIALYDSDDFSLLQTKSFGGQGVQVLHMAQGRSCVYVCTSTTATEGKTVFSVGELIVETGELRSLYQVRGCNGMACSPRDDFVCTWVGREVSMFDVKRQRVFPMLHSVDVYTATFHPKDPLVVVGDRVGKMMLWRCPDASSPASDMVADMLHWHAHGVHTLAFAGPDGSVLISGGQEDAVVFWQLQTRKKLFVPHLGTLGVYTVATAPGGRMHAVVCGDNSLYLITAHDLRVQRKVAGLRTIAPNHVKSFVTLTSAGPDHRCVVLNGKGNSLQWFNVEQDLTVLEVEVLHAGLAPRGRRDMETPPISRVELVGFGSALMVTEDIRSSIAPKRVTPERALKFWKPKSDNTRGWELVCTVLQPHRKRIFALSVDPSSDMVCSVSRDGYWKTWQMVENSQGQLGVVCVAYAAYKGLYPLACCFSRDGSVLAVMFSQSTLTLWDPNSAALLHVASVASPYSQPERICSIPGSSLIVGWGSNKNVWCFDLLSLRVVWRLTMDVTHAAVHWSSGHVAFVCAGAGLVLVHAPSSPQPVWTQSTLHQNPMGVEFVRMGKNSSHLVVLSRSGVFQVFPCAEADTLHADDGAASAAADTSAAAAVMGRFQGILGAPTTTSSTGSPISSFGGIGTDVASSSSLSFLPETASHVLPHASTMLLALMGEILRPPPSTTKSLGEQEDEDESPEGAMELASDGELFAEEEAASPTLDDAGDEDDEAKLPHRFGRELRQQLVGAFTELRAK